MRGPRLTAMAVRNPRAGDCAGEIPDFIRQAVVVLAGAGHPRHIQFCGQYDIPVIGARCALPKYPDWRMQRRRCAAKGRAPRRAGLRREGSLAATGDSSAEAIPPADAAPEDTAPAAQPDAEAAPEQSVAETSAHGKDGGKDKKTSPLMLAVTVVSIVLALALAIGLFIIVPTWLYETLAARMWIGWMRTTDTPSRSLPVS